MCTVTEQSVPLDSDWRVPPPESAQRRICWICVLNNEQDFVGKMVQAEEMA